MSFVTRKKHLIVFGILVVLLGAYLTYAHYVAAGKYDGFAQCLTEKKWVMYGTDWCPHCQKQKAMFGNSFKYITFVNCDLGTACTDAGVQGYPTWGKDGEPLQEAGVKELSVLSTLSQCPLP